MHLNVLDWIAVAIIGGSGLIGLRRGLLVSAFSLAGLAAGTYAGSRVGPHLLHGGAKSPWTPVAGLACAVFGAVLLQTVAVFLGSFARGGLRLTPLRFLDSLGGLVFGAATGLVLVWVMGAVALLLPGQTQLRQDVRGSSFVRRIDDVYPPDKALHLLARIDPYPSIAGPKPPTAAPTPHISTNANVRRETANVVRVLGRACGVGIEGTGWYAGPRLVVTAAHVVAGERTTEIEITKSGAVYHVQVVAFNAHNDIAVLRVPGAAPVARPLRLVQPVSGSSVAIVGYPENGPLQATPGRIGVTESAITQDAYGNGPVTRMITTLAGVIRHGDSGAPAIDARGNVQATVFAARLGTSGGYAVPASVVRRVLESAGTTPVSTGACAP